MKARPLPLAAKAARLAVQKPWLTYSQVCAELAKRRRRKPAYGVLHPNRDDRAAFAGVESPRHAWQDRKDLQ